MFGIAHADILQIAKGLQLITKRMWYGGKAMDTDKIIRHLEYEADKHKNDRLFTGQINITAMCRDLIPKMKALKRYEELEQDGRLLELPCKVESLVYEIYQFMGEGAWEIDVHKIRLEDLDKIGKTVFLTKENAKAALKEMEGREKR